jgi:drug/metabolite transporter (DMT)-like permease
MLDSYRDPIKGFKVLRYALVIAILVLIVVSVIVFYIPFLVEHSIYRYIVLLLWALVAFAFYRAYGRHYYKSRPKESRVVFVVCFSLASGFMISAILALLLGQLLLRTYSLLLFFAIVGVGAFVWDKVGKKLGLY